MAIIREWKKSLD